MRSAKFSVEHLFSRAKTFDAEDGAAAQWALTRSRFNALIGEPEYAPADTEAVR